MALHFLLRVLGLIVQLPMGVDTGRVLGKGLNFSFLTQLFPKKMRNCQGPAKNSSKQWGMPTSLGTSS